MIFERRRRSPSLVAALGVAIGFAGMAAPNPAAAAPNPAAAAPTPAAAPSRAPAGAQVGDGPSGYFFGTDSSGVPVPVAGRAGTPAVGGVYGSYTGMAGDWAASAGCGNYQLAWSAVDAAAAARDYAAYHAGVGAGAYWFMGGPGVDPHYDGTAAEAAAWGRQQAVWALAALAPLHLDQPVLWMDVELPGSTVFDPVTDNGWTTVYRSACDAQPSGATVTPTLARAELDGFASYVEAHSHLAPGVYSDPSMWASIFGRGPASVLTGTYEWTADDQTSSLAPLPYGWCRPGTAACAGFFGGVTSASPYALAWQWSGGEGTRNGVGDFDTVDAPRMAAVAAGGLPPSGVQETVGIAADPATGGYWLVTSAGNVFDYHAPFFGSLAGHALPAPVTGIAATATGYLLTTTTGRVYAFHTPYYGSATGADLVAPVTGVAADPTSGGYWLTTSAGNVLAFHAPWYGSPAGRSLSGVVGIAATRSGYVVAAASGKAYPFHSPSHPGTSSGSPAVGVAADPAGGYWLARAGGGVTGFGAPVYGRAHTPAGG